MKTVFVLLACLSAAALAGQSWQDDAAWRDSLIEVPPRFRADWLRARGLDDPFVFGTIAAESSGLNLLGKWGGGPAGEVTGRDSLVVLSRGSEVVLVRHTDTDGFRVLATIQAQSLVAQASIDDTVLYIGDFAEVTIWDVSDPANPSQLSTIPYGVGDFAVWDSLLAFTRQNTFRVYSVADPAHPRELGTLPDSGTVRAASSNRFVLSSAQDIVYIIDCTDPAHPQRRGSYPGYALGLDVRGSLCCAAMYWSTDEDHFRFDVLDISDPDNIRRIGYLSDVGGYDIHLEDSLAFVSGFQSSGYEFTVVNLADSTNPVEMGACTTPGDNPGVWSRLAAGRGYVADRYRGLTVVDISDPGNPLVDTSLLGAGFAKDVWVDGDYAYVASDIFGMVILDVTDPANPVELGHIDSTRAMVTRSVAARDSFAYMGHAPGQPRLRSVDVSDPAHPVKAGGEDLFDWPEDMVLRDTLLYIAEAYRFQVVNVARPREPVLVGSCVLPGNSGDLWLQDSVAYVTNSGLFFVNVANPAAPQVIGTWPGWVLGVEVIGATAYCSGVYFFATLDVSNPAAPQKLDSTWLVDNLYDVAVMDTLAYAGGNLLRVFNCADPSRVRQVGTWTPPYSIRRVVYEPPYLYVACWDAGVCVLETVETGLAETTHDEALTGCLGIAPNPASASVLVWWGASEPRLHRWRLYDAAGRVRRSGKGGDDEMSLEVDLTLLETGVYFLEVQLGSSFVSAKVVRR